MKKGSFQKNDKNEYHPKGAMEKVKTPVFCGLFASFYATIIRCKELFMSDSLLEADPLDRLDLERKWVTCVSRRDLTYNDYKSWPEDIHAEIIDGQVYLMAAPNHRHAHIQMVISGQLDNYFMDKTCLVITAKFGVRLDYQESGLDTTTVEPDILIVCDRAKVLNKPECQGTPDFILEIVSKGELKKDLEIKRDRYERAGVKEYWVIGQTKLHIFNLINGKYTETIKELTQDLKQPLNEFPDCIVDFRRIAEYPVPVP